MLMLHAGVSNCRIVAPAYDMAFKTCDKPKIQSTVKLFIFAKHDQLSLSDIFSGIIFDTGCI